MLCSQPAVAVEHWPWGTGRGALAVGHWPWGTGRGALAVGHWPWGTGRGALAVGHWPWGTGRGALAVGHWPWGTASGMHCPMAMGHCLRMHCPMAMASALRPLQAGSKARRDSSGQVCVRCAAPCVLFVSQGLWPSQRCVGWYLTSRGAVRWSGPDHFVVPHLLLGASEAAKALCSTLWRGLQLFGCYSAAQLVDSAHCQHTAAQSSSLLTSKAWQQDAYQVSNIVESSSQARDSFWTDTFQHAASALSCH